MDAWARFVAHLIDLGFRVEEDATCPPWFAAAVKKHPPGRSNLLRWALRHCPRVIDETWHAKPPVIDPDDAKWKAFAASERGITDTETSRVVGGDLQFRVLHPAAVAKYAYIRNALSRSKDYFRTAQRPDNPVWDGFPDDWFLLPLAEMAKLLVGDHPVDLVRKTTPRSSYGKLQLFRERLLRAQMHRRVRPVFLPDPSKLLFVRPDSFENSAWGDRDRSVACVDDLMMARLRDRFGLRLSEAIRIARRNEAWIDAECAVYIMFVYDPIDPLCAGGVYVGKARGDPASRVLQHLKQTDHLVDLAVHAVPPTQRCLPCVVAVILETGIDEMRLRAREEVYTRLFCGFGPGGFNMIAASKDDGNGE